ncbi:ABC transporter ATP-binding protein [uncultured Psychromonas sp.]|uniref:ABC transporter ATP-binding protein n=1 Tax=uncultured Psychromonas sp. TaxID=173974 RepID=UPI00260DFFB3|nr:ABC transporter ATP-binding protein [uncultured Psychromonas sp.]
MTALLTVNNLSCHLGGKIILNDISCEFQQGKVTALVGPNGSGKSTLLKLIAGLETSSAGDITLSGKGVAQYSRADLAIRLAMLPQRHATPVGLTVADLVEFGRHPHRRWFAPLTKKDKQKMHWAMQEAGVLEFANLAIETLSGGEAQRCWLAMVLAQDTDIVLLDEPTSWLDIGHQVELLHIVKRLNEQYGKTIIWVLHDLNHAQTFSHQAIMLEKGKVVAAGDVDVVFTAERISEVYNTSVARVEVEGQALLWPRTSAKPELMTAVDSDPARQG